MAMTRPKKAAKKPKPVAVLIADVHYSLATLALADAAMRQAIAKANNLDVPLIVAGDLHDTKANMRAECISAMIKTFRTADKIPFVLRGNHDAVNEKSKEHALDFLAPYAHVVAEPKYDKDLNIHLIPYHHDRDELAAYLKTLPSGSTLIVHQGLEGSHMGDYVQDKSALAKENFAPFRTISGHYHMRQTIECAPPFSPNTGHVAALSTFSYIGNPYTLNFAEALDPVKGFQVLMDDGSLEHVPTNLRKHVVVDVRLDEPYEFDYNPLMDVLWVKLRGSKEQLVGVDRKYVAKQLGLDEHGWRLDLIPDEAAPKAVEAAPEQTQPELLDALIEAISTASPEQKARVKTLWKSL